MKLTSKYNFYSQMMTVMTLKSIDVTVNESETFNFSTNFKILFLNPQISK